MHRAQFPVSDKEKIAAAAGRIKEFHPAEPFLKLQQIDAAAAAPSRLQLPELGPQIVHEQRLDDL